MRISVDMLRSILAEAILNAYNVLGLQQGASDDEIKRAWKALALKNHPDRGGSHGAMVDINSAKDRLLDKTALFRFGPTFKGYEIAGSQVKSEPVQPEANLQKLCPHCGRNVSIKDGKYVNHYTHPMGSTKCKMSGQSSYSARQKARQDQRNNQKIFFENFFVRQVGDRTSWVLVTRNYDDQARKYTVVYNHVDFVVAPKARPQKIHEFQSRPDASDFCFLLFKNLRRKRFSTEDEINVPKDVVAMLRAQKPSSDARASGKDDKEKTVRTRGKAVYKVYNWKKRRSVVRVGTILFGTGPDRTLSDGKVSKYRGGDRVTVKIISSTEITVIDPNIGVEETWKKIGTLEETIRLVNSLVLEHLLQG